VVNAHGLALGGGGAKGLCRIAYLKALDELGVRTGGHHRHQHWRPYTAGISEAGPGFF
jgi:hypothetical protein